MSSWTSYTADPTARYLAAAGVVSGVLYVVDGTNGSNLATNNGFNPSTNAWTSYAADPTARQAPAAGVISGVLYVVDGNNGSSLATNNGFNPSTNAWTAYAADPTARQYAAAGVISGILYVVDGYNGSDLATNNGYNPSTNAWTAYASDPTARHGPAAGVISGILYVVDGNNGAFLATNNGYNPSTNAWTSYAADPTARNLSAAGVISGVLYVVDGNNGSSLATNNGFNPSTNAWTAYASDPSARIGPAAGVISGVMYVVDGYSNSTSTYLATNNGFQPASAPNAPTLDSPANAAYLDATLTQSFTPTYNSTDGANQNAYAMRVKTSGASSYSYWNASTAALQSTIVWNAVSTAPGAQWTVSIPAGVFSNGSTYNWSMASQEASANLQGPFASDFTFTAQASPTLSVQAPTGTVVSSTVTAQWTTTPPSGASQTAYEIKVESGSFSTTPGSGTLVWDSGVVQSGTQVATIGVVLTNYTTYRCFIQVTETGGETSGWVYTTFTVEFDYPATPTLTATPATDANGTPYIAVTIQGHDNIISTADASFEGSLGTWGAGSGAAPSLTTEAALDGSYSMAITVTGGTQQRVFEAAANNPVAPGVTYTVTASFRPVSTTRSMAVLFETFDGTNAYQGVAGSTTVTETSGAWVTATFQATTPAGAATGRIQLGWATDVGTLPLGAPTGLAVTTATTGGSIGASVTRYYKITAVNAYGQTTASTEVSVTTGSTTSTNANTLTWTALSGATSYNVYAATASGSEQLLASGVTTTSYTDTVATLPSGAAPPTTDTTGERHDVDRCGIFPGTVTSWTRGGLAGIGSATVTYTDANNTAPVTLRNTPITLPTPSQQVVVADYEATPSVARTYTATVSATV